LDAAQKLRGKVALEGAQRHAAEMPILGILLRQLRDEAGGSGGAQAFLGADVAGEEKEAGGEVHVPIAPIVQLGAVQHAQQQGIERVVGLFNFVEENERIGEFRRAIALN